MVVPYSTKEYTLHLTFPNIYYFESFSLLTIRKCYLISIIWISQVDSDLELPSYVYHLLSFLLNTLSSCLLEKNPTLLKSENQGEHIFLLLFPMFNPTNHSSHIVPLLPHITYFQEENAKRERRKRKEKRESSWKKGKERKQTKN